MMNSFSHKQKAIIICVLAAAVLLLIILAGGKQKAHSVLHRKIKAIPDAYLTEVEVVIVPPVSVPKMPMNPATGTAESEASGIFPPLWCSYREQVGFRNYATEMERRGAVFFLYSRTKGGWFQIDRKNSALKPFSIGQIGSIFGSNPNCIEDEPALGTFAADEPDGEVEVYLAKPLSMETHIQAAVQQALNSQGIPMAKVAGVKCIYDFVNGKFSLVIREIATRDMGIRIMNHTIPL